MHASVHIYYNTYVIVKCFFTIVRFRTNNRKKNIVAGKHEVFPNYKVKKKKNIEILQKKIRNNTSCAVSTMYRGENGGTSRAVVMRVHNIHDDGPKDSNASRRTSSPFDGFDRARDERFRPRIARRTTTASTLIDLAMTMGDYTSCIIYIICRRRSSHIVRTDCVIRLASRVYI